MAQLGSDRITSSLEGQTYMREPKTGIECSLCTTYSVRNPPLDTFLRVRSWIDSIRPVG